MEQNKRYKKGYKISITIAVIISLLDFTSIQTLASGNTTLGNIQVCYGQTEGRSILDMINNLRTGSDAWYWNEDNRTKTYCKNLNELSYDYELEKFAMQRAAEIAVYFSHTRPNGKSCFSIYEENGLEYGYVGENIAYGYMTAEAVNEAFWEANQMYNGQGHRRNMLGGNYKTVGIGHAYYNGVHYWVEEFSSEQYSHEKTEPEDGNVTVQIELDSTHAIANTTPTQVSSNCKVTFHENGGTSLQFSQKTVKKNTSLGILPSVKRKGYTLKGWYSAKKGGSKITSATKITKNMTLYAQWSKVAKPTKVTNLTVKSTKKGQCTITYKEIAKVSGYQTAYSTDKKFSSKNIKYSTTIGSKATLKNLKKGKRYYVKVRAYRLDSEKNKVYGSYSSVKSVVIKK